jgi:tetratricopeptide (TPR) repeat protein
MVLSKDIKYTNIFSKKNEVDGIVVVPELHYGTYYQYVPLNENLKYLLRIIKEYEERLDNNYLKDEKFITTDPQAQYLMAIYYLKMYYGNAFEYNFWRKTDEGELPLVEAVKRLQSNVFYDGNPAEHIKFSYSSDQIRLYSKYMFYSNIEGLLELKNEFRKTEDVIRYCLEAQTTFPEDIWPLYWIAYTQTKLERYAEALISFEKLFAHNLSYCMEILPLAYEHAAICAKQTNNEELYRYYDSMAAGLHNEHSIDVAGYYYTGHLYDGSFGTAARD